MVYVAIVLAIGAFFMLLERIWPGRALPRSPSWLLRAVFFNTCQLGLITLGGHSWELFFQQSSIFSLASELPAFVQGLVAWFIGTFVFYWWHRVRHESPWCWRWLHQIHHSASRIETLTSFYKHPAEITANSILASMVIYGLLGCSLAGAGWFNVFAATGEFFYHGNLKTPHWVGVLMQRPEHHSIHHEFDVHRFNFGDITLWDRLFGTFRDTNRFADRCGFPAGCEDRIGSMLIGRDVT